MNHKKFDFPAVVAAGLRRLGAREGGSYGWRFDTISGVLDVKPFDTWVACRFVNVELANAKIDFGCLNRFSGKWNRHYAKPTSDDAVFFLQQLESIAVQEAS